MSGTLTPIEVFSYEHEDEPFCKELEKHLSLLQRKGLVTHWQDCQILPGTDWGNLARENIHIPAVTLTDSCKTRPFHSRWTKNNVWLQLRMIGGRFALLLSRKKRMINS